MVLSSANSVTNQAASPSEASATSKMNVSSLGKDDFLKLLIAELKHQNPLDPADNTEFVAQLAQFSSLEQMTQMNENIIKSIETSTSTTEAINNVMMISYIGRNVEAESSEFPFDGVKSVELYFELENPMSSGKLEIIDSAGDVIRTIKLGAKNSGENTVTWDGITNRGVYVEPGIYSFQITAIDGMGEEVSWNPRYSGIVEGITTKEGESYLNVDGVLIPIEKVTSVSNGG